MRKALIIFIIGGCKFTPIYRAIVFSGIIGISLQVACKNPDEKKMDMLNNKIVHIDINGHFFDIPLSYAYGETLEKWGNWPDVKEERIKVDYLHLSMLLPDLKPYQPKYDSRWKVPGNGERIEVTLMKPVGGNGTAWFENSLKGIREYLLKNNSLIEKGHYGLLHISDQSGDHYYDQENKSLVINCSKSDVVDFPSCKIKSQYRENLVLEYYYGLNFLSQWRDINNNLKKLFNQFSQSKS